MKKIKNIFFAFQTVTFLTILVSCELFSGSKDDSAFYSTSKMYFEDGKDFDVPKGTNDFAHYFPDGEITSIKYTKDGSNLWQIFWAERQDFLTTASTPWPEDHYNQIVNSNIIFGEGKSSVKGLNENGSWFIGVFPLDDAGHYAGFFHGESWWESDWSKPNAGVAYKSIGVAYSNDYGKTWQDAQPIIRDSKPKGENPEWSGLGDGTVIRDEQNNRWICYYSAPVIHKVLWTEYETYKICMAVSYDPKGASGTWKKWDGNDFTIPAYNSSTGIGGTNIPVQKLDSVAGSNPNVIWNTFLNEYVMVYSSWEKDIYLSFSSDGLHWSEPEVIIKNAVYPNIISEEGSSICGEKARLYYGKNMDSKTGKRKLAYMSVQFTKQ